MINKDKRYSIAKGVMLFGSVCFLLLSNIHTEASYNTSIDSLVKPLNISFNAGICNNLYEYSLVDDDNEFILNILEEIKQNNLKYILTDEEKSLLQRLVMGEAEGETFDGKVAVAQVVLNRVTLREKSLYDVVYEKNEFTCTIDGRIDLEPSQECIDVVDYVLYGGTIIDEDVEYFYSTYGDISIWHEYNLEYATTIGNHKFFKE